MARFVARPVPKTVHEGPDMVAEPSQAELTVPVTPAVLKRPSRSSLLGLGGGAQRVAV